MNKLLLAFTFCICLVQLGFSQNQPDLNTYPNLGIMQYTVITEYNTSEDEIYQNSVFQPGILTTKENLELNSIKFRYNIRKDQMECSIGSQHSIINSPQELKEISINGNCFEYQKYLVKKDTSDGYLLKIHKGDQAIYAKYYVPSNKTIEPKSKSFFLLKNKGELPKKIGSVKALITKHFTEQEKEIREYNKKHNLNWNNPMDLKKLISYLEDLNHPL